MSRARKLPRCDGDTEALERQLNNDFEVHNYLEAHALDRYPSPYPATTPTSTLNYSTHWCSPAAPAPNNSANSKTPSPCRQRSPAPTLRPSSRRYRRRRGRKRR